MGGVAGHRLLAAVATAGIVVASAIVAVAAPTSRPFPGEAALAYDEAGARTDAASAAAPGATPTSEDAGTQPPSPGSVTASGDSGDATSRVLAATARSTRYARRSTTTTSRPTPTSVTPTTAAATSAARVPIGDIVYDSGIGGSRFEIFRMKPDGSGITQLTDDPAYNSWWPRPSPARTRILFYRTPAGVVPATYAQASLWIMNADGSNPRVVLPAGYNGWKFQAHAEWAPSGTRIVFTAGSTQALITTITPSGGELTVLGGGPGANVDPSYSPDGRWIVYVGCPSWTCTMQSTEVFKMPADGSGARVQLTYDGLRDQDPVLSPDGHTVAFLTQTDVPNASSPYGQWHLRTIGADGTNVRQITSGSSLESAPRWSPDGTRIWTHRTVHDSYVWDLTSMRPDGTDLKPIKLPWTQEFPAFAG
jgi:Tol biopolymer transport system component